MYRYITFEALSILLLVFSSATFASTSDRREVVNKLFESYNSKGYNKCGFHIIAHYLSLPHADLSVKAALQYRPTNDTSIVSPSGKFRIHFDTSGVNQPFLYSSTGQEIPNSTFAYADTVAAICDHVYFVEVDSLGFPPPASDSGAGGGNEYDIYIEDLPTGEYGYTDWDNTHPIISRANPTYATWTVIRNEYQSTYTKGIPAIEVTIAHEFNHGIQIGNYGLWQDELYFYELTATWMEQVVYPQVKDYYQYLTNFFDNVNEPFNSYNPETYAGYERCVFGIFVQNEYSIQLMKSIWQNMAHEPVLPSIEDAFKHIGVNPSYAFQLFAQWNYLTGYRSALAGEYGLSTYPESENYPPVKISGIGDLSGSGVDFSDNALSLSEHFYQVNDGPDTVGIGVANTNFAAAAESDTASHPFSVGISSGGTNCVRELKGGYCLFFNVSNYSNWGLVPFILSQALAARGDVVFPQPFNPAFQEVKIPYPFQDANTPSLYVYSVSGELLNTLSGDSYLAYYLRGRYFLWDGRESDGKTVASGIYIYVLTDGSRSVMGKIAVVRN